MSQDNSNSILEMGTSDQVLVATKKKKNLIWIAGGIAMVIVIAVVITLVVVLTGNESDADDVTTTEGTTSPITITPTIPPTIIPTTEATTPAPEPPDTTPEQPEPTTPVPTTPVPTTPVPSTTEEPEPTTTAPPLPDDSILLEDILTGVFSPPTFNGTWTGENEVLFRGTYGDLVIYNVDTNQSRVLIDNSSTILQQSARFLQLSPDGQQVVLAHNVAPVYRHSFLARYTAINLETDAPTDIVPPGVPANDAYLQNFVWGPTGTALAFVYRNNVYYQASLTATPVQITTTGVDDILYHGIPDWVYEEEVFGSNSALWFSADGSKLAYGSFDDTNVRIMKVPHYGVPGSLEYQYTQHHEIRYPKPGTTNPTVSVTLLDIESDVRTVYTVPTDLEQPILRAVSFVSNDVAIMWANRVQNEVKVELCNQLSVICNEIFTHSEPDGWIDNIPLIFNTAGNSFVTILPQAVNGVLYKQIVQATAGTVGASWTVQDRTNTAHTVGEILLWTADDVIWYKATHERDSAEQHVYTVTADRVVSCFTCDIVREDGGECLYNDAAINREATRITVNCAGPSIPQIYVVDNSANIISTLHGNHEVAELLTERALPPIIRLSVPVATGFPDADVHIQVPADYQLRTNVPLLVYVYGGPDTSLVTKQWNIDWGTSLVTRWNIAVAHIDGRGSGLRGVANTFALNRHLGGAEVDDQISVTRYLHENLSWVDSNRTCIWGWSYGGYAASLALARGGDVFRCAAAVAPVVDWRFYDTIYTERYMDLPTNNVEGYAQSSLLTDDVVEVYRDKRYFLVHGTADDNVHYQHAMVFSRLLQRRDVYFTQMSYTDEDHGLVGVRPHLYHGLEKFLQDNML